MSTLTFDDIADELHTARLAGQPIAAPTETWPSLDADAAFAVQKINVDRAIADGDRLVGYKLGNIAKVMQDAFGLDQPDYGHLLASLFVYEGTTLAREQFIEPFVELEPAFVLRRALRGPNVTIADVISAIDYALPAIEIIDSRVRNWAIGLPDTLADNGSTGAVILGGTPRALTDLNLRDTRGVLRFNDREVIAGSTGYILGNPLAATAWLVNRLADYGVEFEAGPGDPSRQLPAGRPDERSRPVVGDVRGLGHHRIRRHHRGELTPRFSSRPYGSRCRDRRVRWCPALAVARLPGRQAAPQRAVDSAKGETVSDVTRSGHRGRRGGAACSTSPSSTHRPGHRSRVGRDHGHAEAATPYGFGTSRFEGVASVRPTCRGLGELESDS